MSAAGDVTAGEAGRAGAVYDSYARLSRVPETGELEKIETQLVDNRRVIERLGGVLGEELSDGLSAWKRGVRRPGWERLLARVRSGESAGIVVWHTDRLFRQPRDLETLIELGDRGFKVASAHGERDLSNPDDRYILRIEVAHAARSSDDTSRRAKRRVRVLKEEKGRAYVGGPRRFGFPGLDLTWRGPNGERRQTPAEVVERERAAIRDAAAAVLAGVADAQIAREWNAAGVLTPAGKEWLPTGVRSTLLRPALAGLVEHNGVIVGRMDGEPILDVETFERLRARFAGRRRGRPPGEKSIGSGIVRCGSCGTGLVVRPHTGTYSDGERRRQYYCDPRRNRACGRVAVDQRALDRELRELVIARLSDSRHAAAIAAARAQVADRLAAVTAEIGDIERLQRALSDRLGRREISLDSFDVANRPLAEDLARLTVERDELSGGNPAGPTEAMSAETVAAQWDDPDASVADRRAMLTAALGRSWLVVDPVKAAGVRRTFDRRRVRLVEPAAFRAA